MSPRERNRNVPSKLMTSKEVAVGEDRNERAGANASGGVEPGEGGDTAFGFGGDVVGRELSAGEASRAAVSGGRSKGSEAPERGGRVESCAAHGRASAGVGAGAGEVQRGDRRAVWADAGRGAFGQRRRRDGASRHAAAVDAGRRPLESRAQAV